ncbi:MAG: threonylcarbamoyl-AMP synthase [Acidobacteriia bacterium]|nr:threonylcarbamoyl-AMP synthase [Terriglobia bacterium]
MIPDEELRRAAAVLRAGGLVAFPTETVYGLGANALDPNAVARIFAVKGRPSTNPLIVHAASVEMARELAAEWPGAAEALARRYWPGPLTIVLRKHASVPDNVTAGLDTVALRVPSHPVALALIRAAGVPLAAPSANRFTELSPTKAAHVSLGDAVEMVLDGGACEVGIESTVISLVGKPVLLRPGMISREELEALIGPVSLHANQAGAQPSPGLHPRHYSPRTQVVLLARGDSLPAGRGAVLGWTPKAETHFIVMPRAAAAYAAALYAKLHELDTMGFDWIGIEQPPAGPEWTGIMDRLRRASHL